MSKQKKQPKKQPKDQEDEEHIRLKVTSITVRPRDGIEERFRDYAEKLENIVKSYNVVKYAFSVEKQGSAGSHIQGIMTFNGQRQDNVREGFKKRFPPIDSAEARNGFVIRNHDDEKFLLGYISKEYRPFYLTYSDTEVNEAIKYYNECIEKMKKNKSRTTGYDVHDKLFENWRSLEEEYKYNVGVHRVCEVMIHAGTLRPSEYAKIKKESMNEYMGMFRRVRGKTRNEIKLMKEFSAVDCHLGYNGNPSSLAENCENEN